MPSFICQSRSPAGRGPPRMLRVPVSWVQHPGLAEGLGAFSVGNPMGQCCGEMPGRQILGWNNHRLLDATGVSWRMELCGAARGGANVTLLEVCRLKPT